MYMFSTSVCSNANLIYIQTCVYILHYYVKFPLACICKYVQFCAHAYLHYENSCAETHNYTHIAVLNTNHRRKTQNKVIDAHQMEKNLNILHASSGTLGYGSVGSIHRCTASENDPEASYAGARQESADRVVLSFAEERSFSEYVAQENEKPTSIAQKLGVSLQQLMALNASRFPVPLFSTSKFKSGTIVHIPLKGKESCTLERISLKPTSKRKASRVSRDMHAPPCLMLLQEDAVVQILCRLNSHVHVSRVAVVSRAMARLALNPSVWQALMQSCYSQSLMEHVMHAKLAQAKRRREHVMHAELAQAKRRREREQGRKQERERKHERERERERERKQQERMHEQESRQELLPLSQKVPVSGSDVDTSQMALGCRESNSTKKFRTSLMEAGQNLEFRDAIELGMSAVAEKGRKTRRQAAKSSDLAVGDYVRARYRDGNWHAAIIRALRSDGKFEIAWMDGDTFDTVKSVLHLRRPDLSNGSNEAPAQHQTFGSTLPAPGAVARMTCAGAAESKRDALDVAPGIVDTQWFTHTSIDADTHELVSRTSYASGSIDWRRIYYFYLSHSLLSLRSSRHGHDDDDSTGHPPLHPTHTHTPERNAQFYGCKLTKNVAIVDRECGVEGEGTIPGVPLHNRSCSLSKLFSGVTLYVCGLSSMCLLLFVATLLARR